MRGYGVRTPRSTRDHRGRGNVVIEVEVTWYGFGFWVQKYGVSQGGVETSSRVVSH